MAALTAKSYVDIVKECDNLPYYDPTDPFPALDLFNSFYRFFLPHDPNPHGMLLTSTVMKMPWTADFIIDHRSTPKRLTLRPLACTSVDQLPTACDTVLSNLLEHARDEKLFTNLEGWTNRKTPILTSKFPLSIERSATLLFGILSYGVHLTLYITTPSGLKFWVPRRSHTKSTYPGKLDNSIEAGISRGIPPCGTVMRRAIDKLGLPENSIHGKTRAAGYISWFHAKDTQYGCEPGLLRPYVQYVYDLEIEADVVINPMADANEVGVFQLYSLSEVQAALLAGAFKPSAAMVFLDFFVRHKILTTENEKDFGEIRARLHRRLPFRVFGD